MMLKYSGDAVQRHILSGDTSSVESDFSSRVSRARGLTIIVRRIQTRLICNRKHAKSVVVQIVPGGDL
jgi:hypothetical protein